MDKQIYDIFISYRRVGGAQYARILQLMLQQRGYRVFLDYDELKDGVFGEHIVAAIKEAPIFMFVMSEGTLDRCKNEDDWVRQEILLAIEQKKHIIPVNPDNNFGKMPEDIPEEIKTAVGSRPQNTLYAGSDDVDEVAWYKDNANGQVHQSNGQQGKRPNRLDLYDMCENVEECCNSPFSTGTDNAPYAVCGGDYNSPASEVTITSRRPLDTDIGDKAVGFSVTITKNNQ